MFVMEVKYVQVISAADEESVAVESQAVEFLVAVSAVMGRDAVNHVRAEGNGIESVSGRDTVERVVVDIIYVVVKHKGVPYLGKTRKGVQKLGRTARVVLVET